MSNYAHLGLPKQSVHRLCRTLVDEGFLERSTDPARLQPAARLREAASGLLAASHVDIGRRQVLEHIAGKVREAVNFVVPAPDGMVYLDRVDTDWPLRIQLPVGSRVPFHCTASGKTYLASLPRRRRRAGSGLPLQNFSAAAAGGEAGVGCHPSPVVFACRPAGPWTPVPRVLPA